MKSQSQVLYFLYVRQLLLLHQSFCRHVRNPTTSQLFKTLSQELVLMWLQNSVISFILNLSSVMWNKPTCVTIFKLFLFIKITFKPSFFVLNVRLKIFREFFVIYFLILLTFRKIQLHISNFNIFPVWNVSSNLKHFNFFVNLIPNHFPEPR